VFVCIFLLFDLSTLLLVSPGPTQYIFHTPMARYSLYVLKVPLNTKQTNKQLTCMLMCDLFVVANLLVSLS